MRQGSYIVVVNIDDVDATAVCSCKDSGTVLGQAKDDVLAELGVGSVVCADSCSVFFKYFDTVIVECEPDSALVVNERGRDLIFLAVWRFENFAAVDVNEDFAGVGRA